MKAKVLRQVLAAVVAAVLVIAAIVLMKDRKRHGIELFGRRPAKVESVEAVVTDIRGLSELTTACYYEEFVLRQEKGTADELVIIAKGTVRAGVDLSRMEDEDFRFSGDTAFVRLPEPEYLDVIINPSGFEIFARTGYWTEYEVSRLKSGARERLVVGADAAGVKRKAGEYSRESVEALLRGLGIKVVVFEEGRVEMPRGAIERR